MQSEGELLLSMPTSSQNDEEVQERTAEQHKTNLEEFKEFAPQKKVAERHWYGWPSLCSGLGIVGIGILVTFYLYKYR
ncbi:hypothetical protein AAFF_G00311840 [Aldrovandia affinis]|uniref:Uncharacterized protein n=1 Tax=Aldrovandia affinis TaxID=143900 RepID=A0AAD7WQP6_9TELE|nr:hypothetical protein AAFF_G00311840 [Aldrovandia affinis]